MRVISKRFTRESQNDLANRYDEKDDAPISKAEDWRLMPSVKEFHANDKASGRQLGITWNNLTIKGVDSGAAVHENVLSQFNIPQQAKESRGGKALKTIINSSSGCVKPHEMLLVLGRPGSGCTTLLKALANRTKGYTVQHPLNLV